MSHICMPHICMSTPIRLIIIANRGCLSFWSTYTLTVITINIANPALGVTSLYKDFYHDDENETLILYQWYMRIAAILVPIVSAKLIESCLERL